MRYLSIDERGKIASGLIGKESRRPQSPRRGDPPFGPVPASNRIIRQKQENGLLLIGFRVAGTEKTVFVEAGYRWLLAFETQETYNLLLLRLVPMLTELTTDTNQQVC